MEDQRISKILDFMQRLASGRLDQRMDPAARGDDLDAVAEGLSMLAEELESRMVSIEEYQRVIGELKAALAQVKQLRGILPICAWCQKIRDDTGSWSTLETYLQAHSDAEFSHGMCPDCFEKYGR